MRGPISQPRQSVSHDSNVSLIVLNFCDIVFICTRAVFTLPLHDFEVLIAQQDLLGALVPEEAEG